MIAIGIGCADPGRDALARAQDAAERLIAIAEKRSRGELEGARLAAALSAWSESEGTEIGTLSEDAARALGKARRAALAEAWRTAAEPLRKRLRAIGSENRTPR